MRFPVLLLIQQVLTTAGPHPQGDQGESTPAELHPESGAAGLGWGALSIAPSLPSGPAMAPMAPESKTGEAAGTRGPPTARAR